MKELNAWLKYKPNLKFLQKSIEFSKRNAQLCSYTLVDKRWHVKAGFLDQNPFYDWNCDLNKNTAVIQLQSFQAIWYGKL